MDNILKYFKGLSKTQIDQLYVLPHLYLQTPESGVLERKSIETFYKYQVLYSYSVARFMQFKPGTRILDVGTGSGFPSIPLCILFPNVQFVLCDYVNLLYLAKEVASFLELQNVTFHHGYAQELSTKHHFVIGRAVAYPSDIYSWTKQNLSTENFNSKPNGYMLFKDDYLKKEIHLLRETDKELVIEEYYLNTLYGDRLFGEQKMVYFYKP